MRSHGRQAVIPTAEMVAKIRAAVRRAGLRISPSLRAPTLVRSKAWTAPSNAPVSTRRRAPTSSSSKRLRASRRSSASPTRFATFRCSSTGQKAGRRHRVQYPPPVRAGISHRHLSNRPPAGRHAGDRRTTRNRETGRHARSGDGPHDAVPEVRRIPWFARDTRSGAANLARLMTNTRRPLEETTMAHVFEKSSITADTGSPDDRSCQT